LHLRDFKYAEYKFSKEQILSNIFLFFRELNPLKIIQRLINPGRNKFNLSRPGVKANIFP